MQRQEVPHNTTEQVEQYVRYALALVEHVAPPDDLRAAVFTAAVGLYSAKQLLLTQQAPLALDHRLLKPGGH